MLFCQMQQIIRKQLNDLRALDRVVNSIQFYECLTLDPNNPFLAQAIEAGNLEEIKDWMKEVISKQIGSYNIRQLRILGTQLGIQAVTTYTKEDLLIAIVQIKAQHAPNEAPNTVSSMSSSANGHKANVG